MGLFDNAAEQQRKQRLAELEDKRLRFAERMENKGFRPESMILCGSDRGGLVGLSRDRDGLWLVVGPDFGGEGEFELEKIDPEKVRFEEYFEPAEGMGGIFGFGKKGQQGYFLYIDRGGVELAVPYIMNRNGCLMTGAAKNPLLGTTRRRGNANPVWDFLPIDRGMLPKLRRELGKLLGREL